MKIKSACCVLLFTATVFAVDVTYDIPPNAVRHGPNLSRDGTMEIFVHTVTNAAGLEDVVANEYFVRNVRVRKVLFRNGELHGIQRAWYPSGQRRYETSWDNGVRDGVFQSWAEDGTKLSDYTMAAGTGTLRIYRADGVLEEEMPFVNNLVAGVVMKLREDGRRKITRFTSNVQEGWGYTFFPDGSLAEMFFYSGRPSFPSGPMLSFMPNGAIKLVVWMLNGSKVTAAQYAAEAAANPSLPPYHADAATYKTLVEQWAVDMDRYYAALPPHQF